MKVLQNKLVTGEQGMSMLLGVAFLFCLASLAAIGLGLGFVATSKSRIQNTANLVTLGVLEVISKQASNANAVPRANQIAAFNDIPGVASWDLIDDDGDGGPGGRIIYGNWFFEDPDGTGGPADPCSNNYPCFAPAPTYSPTVNAVRVKMRNRQGRNPIIAPFVKMFGYRGGYVNTTATAVIAGQCSVLLHDVSESTTYQTHKPEGVILPAGVKRSSFVYSAATTPTCSDPDTGGEYLCLDPSRSSSTLVDPTVHYQDDYVTKDSISGFKIRVDSFVENGTADSLYSGPEPMRSLFLGTNAALRSLFQGSAGSYWLGVGFENGLLSTLPNGRWVPSTGFATNPGALIQVTNLDNRGTFDKDGNVISPAVGGSFLSQGWYPRARLNGAPQEQTNLIEAFEAAIGAFQNTSLATTCPAYYKKTIVLATDGVGNCWKLGGSPPYQCQNDMVGYRNYLTQVLTTISSELQRKNISVIVLYGGDYVGPHFINRLAPAGFQTSTGSQFLGLEEGLALGYGAIGETNPNLKLFDERPTVNPTGYAAWCTSNCSAIGGCGTNNCRNSYAVSHLAEDGTVFRHPASVLAQLAIDTEGSFCPLLPLYPDPSAYIDHDSDPSTPEVLKDTFRTQDARQEFAIEKLTPSEQAARCLNLKWSNKFVLVTEESDAELPQEIGNPVLVP